MEMSYVDLLLALRESVESDNMPSITRETVLNLIARLEVILWNYSA